MDLSNSASDEEAIIYVAQGLEHREPEPDHNEELALRKLPFGELYAMVMRGECGQSHRGRGDEGATDADRRKFARSEVEPVPHHFAGAADFQCRCWHLDAVEQEEERPPQFRLARDPRRSRSGAR